MNWALTFTYEAILLSTLPYVVNNLFSLTLVPNQQSVCMAKWSFLLHFRSTFTLDVSNITFLLLLRFETKNLQRYHEMPSSSTLSTLDKWDFLTSLWSLHIYVSADFIAFSILPRLLTLLFLKKFYSFSVIFLSSFSFILFSLPWAICHVSLSCQTWSLLWDTLGV